MHLGHVLMCQSTFSVCEPQRVNVSTSKSNHYKFKQLDNRKQIREEAIR